MVKSLFLCVIGGAAFGTAQVHAQSLSPDKPFFEMSGLLTLATDGMSKDASETDNAPQATGNIQAAHGPFFAGLKVKNVKGSDGSDSQQEYSLGMKGKAANFQMGIQAAYKIKVGARHTQNEYVEWKGDVSRAFGKTTAKVEVEYSRDSSGSTKAAIWTEASLAQKLNARWSLSGGIGARRLKPSRNYDGINFGLSYALRPATVLDLRYYDTNRHDYGARHKPHLVLKLSQKL